MISKDVDGNEYVVSVSDLSWRPSAYGIVIHKNNILLVKEHNGFHLPGGGVDLGESPVAAVVREVREETGCTVNNPQLLDMASSLFSAGAMDAPPAVQHVHSLLIYYACTYVSTNTDDIHLDEYEQIAGLSSEWVSLDRLADITVGTTVDWRPVVQRALALR